MIEVWKDIVGYEGVYMVSDQGRLKSLKFGKERLLKPTLNSRGYLMVVLSKEGNRNRRSIHQLMAMTFLGHVPCGHKLVVDHIDEDKINNSLSNLQVITQRENTERSIDISKNSSKYSGVHWNKERNKWMTQIHLNGKQHYLGLFTDEVEASEVVERFRKENNIN